METFAAIRKTLQDDRIGGGEGSWRGWAGYRLISATAVEDQLRRAVLRLLRGAGQSAAMSHFCNRRSGEAAAGDLVTSKGPFPIKFNGRTAFVSNPSIVWPTNQHAVWSMFITESLCAVAFTLRELSEPPLVGE
jgi:hypothetical protein